MGLRELIRVGADLRRREFNINTVALSSGSASLGTAYTLLSVKTTVPCRFRLYDNLQSLNDLGEASRSFSNTSISSSTALIGDFSMSAVNVEYTIDPALYSVIQNSSAGWTYYRVNDASTLPTITIKSYNIEDTTKVASVGSIYSEENRRTLPNIMASVGAGAMASGTLPSTATTVPKTFLLVSASLTGSTDNARLRLYSSTSSLYDSVEKNRSFSVEASASAQLIVDAILTGSEHTYFSPKILAANLQNMKSDLNNIRGNTNLIAGKNEVYYIIENLASSGGTLNISASLHVYSLEE